MIFDNKCYLRKSGGKRNVHRLSQKPHGWQKEEMVVNVKGNKATITFHVEGTANAECSIDDVELTKAE